MTLDANYLCGSVAAEYSILQHTSCPENIHFNFIAAANGGGDVCGIVSTTFPYLSFETYTVDLDLIAFFVSNSIRSALDSPLNYARIYLAKILPTSISKVIFLDSDIILVDDVAHLTAIEFQNDIILAAPEYCNTNFTSYSLPRFLLVFTGSLVPVDHRWNQHGLGGDNYRGLCRDSHPGMVSLMHWSGKGKPWARIESGRACPPNALWASYDLLDFKSNDSFHS
ncbi:unnamed protein product [Rhodiola kirilowii]